MTIFSASITDLEILSNREFSLAYKILTQGRHRKLCNWENRRGNGDIHGSYSKPQTGENGVIYHCLRYNTKSQSLVQFVVSKSTRSSEMMVTQHYSAQARVYRTAEIEIAVHCVILSCDLNRGNFSAVTDSTNWRTALLSKNRFLPATASPNTFKLRAVWKLLKYSIAAERQPQYGYEHKLWEQCWMIRASLFSRFNFKNLNGVLTSVHWVQIQQLENSRRHQYWGVMQIVHATRLHIS